MAVIELISQKESGEQKGFVRFIKKNLHAISRDRFLLFLLLPGLVYFIIFCYAPMYGIVLAFKDYDPTPGVGILGSPWAGLKYYRMIFATPMIWDVLFNTLKFSFSRILFGFPAPIIFALLLNEIKNVRFKKITQTISYLPYFLSWIVISGLLFQILSPSYGLYGLITDFLDIKPSVLLAKKTSFYVVVILSDIWKNVGYGSIIYIAAMAGISPELYEAAKMDGAGRFRQALSITLPCIIPTITILFILQMGQTLNGGFDQIFNLMNQAVIDSADIIDTYVYRRGLEKFEFSYSTAVNLLKNVIGFGLVVFTNWVVSKFSESTLW